MADNVVPLNATPATLTCSGVGRDDQNKKCLIAYFNRTPTDSEMRFFNDCLKRWASLADKD